MFSEESNSIRAPRGFLLGPLKSTQNDEKSIIHLFTFHLANAHRAPPWWVSAVNKLLFSLREVCVLAGEGNKQERCARYKHLRCLRGTSCVSVHSSPELTGPSSSTDADRMFTEYFFIHQ